MINKLSGLVRCLCGAWLALAAPGCTDEAVAQKPQDAKASSSDHPDRPAARVAASDESPGAADSRFTPDHDGHAKSISPFLHKHCVRCHGPDVQEGDFRLDVLANDFLARSTAATWSEVLDRLNVGDMPPKGEPRPAAADVAKVADWISRERLRGERARRATTIVMRRLNRAEYQNTIRELTGVDLQPLDEFPADPPAGGFDNNGSVLTISPLLMELYVKVAQRIADRAIVTEPERPPGIKWRFELEEGSKDGQLDRFRKNLDGQSIFVNAGNNPIRNGMTVLRRQQWDSFAQVWNFKVPRAGRYVIRMRAAGAVPPEESVRQAGPRIQERAQLEQEGRLATEDERRGSRTGYENHVRPSVTRHFETDDRYRYGPPRAKLLGGIGSGQVLGEFDVDTPEHDPRVYETFAWIEPVDYGIVLRNVYHIPKSDWNWWLQGHDDFPRPELLIDWIELEGPLYDDWPPSSHRRILIDSPHKEEDEDAYAREVLETFMRRAYRRPLRKGEVDSKLALFRRVRPECPSFEEAIKVPVVAILASPHFLYMVEDDPGIGSATPGVASTSGTPAPRKLNDFQLASRLSYFLWSDMPDAELFRLAQQGRLANPQALAAQADRMFRDARSEEFIKNFAGQWLKLRDVGANPPAQQIYPAYDDHLEVSIRGESEAFVAHVLHNELSVLNFIRSDFVTINERLARHYGIPDVRGDHFRAVTVPEGVPRGGLVTQASMLTVTSNGTRTSPVARGVWILERLLGDPPPPPPPNAGDIPPGVPGLDKATVRDRLQVHRTQPQCARCHDKIDPLGFALEHFNAAGEWRERESQGRTSEYGPNDPPIDARARIPGGSEFVGVGGLQDELLQRKDQFLRCLAEQLYVYALGRELGYADQPMIDGAVAHMKKSNHTLRSLIHHVVASNAFCTK